MREGAEAASRRAGRSAFGPVERLNFLRAVLGDSNLAKIDLHVAVALQTFANDNGQCWPSVQTIQAQIPLVKDDRTVQRSLRRLATRRHMDRRPGCGRGNTTLYTLRNASPKGLHLLTPFEAIAAGSIASPITKGRSRATLRQSVEAIQFGTSPFSERVSAEAQKGDSQCPERVAALSPRTLSNELTERTRETIPNATHSSGPADLWTQVWKSNRDYVVANGHSESDARKAQARWRRDYHEIDILRAVKTAQTNAVELPIPYIDALLRGKAKQRQESQPKTDAERWADRIEAFRLEQYWEAKHWGPPPGQDGYRGPQL